MIEVRFFATLRQGRDKVSMLPPRTGSIVPGIFWLGWTFPRRKYPFC